MKILFFILCGGLSALAPAAARAQAKVPAAKATAKPPVKASVKTAPVAAPAAGPAAAKTAPAPGTPAATAHVALAPATPAADPTALKIRAEVNPTTRQLAVHTNAPGPTTIEVNDATGRPVLTRNVIAGTKAIELNVAQLPAGYYVVHCTAGLRTGMRRVHLGD